MGTSGGRAMSEEKYNNKELTRIFKDITLSLEKDLKRIEKLEKWQDKSWNMHQEMAQEILPNQLEILEKQIEKLEMTKDWFKTVAVHFRKEISELDKGVHEAIHRTILNREVLREMILDDPMNEKMTYYLEKLDSKEKWQEHDEACYQYCSTQIDEMLKDGEKEGLVEATAVPNNSKEVRTPPSKPSEPIFMEGNCIYKMECENVSKTCHLECDRYHKFDLREFIDYIYKPKEPTEVAGSARQTEDFFRIDDIRRVIQYIDPPQILVEKTDLEEMIDCCEAWFYYGGKPAKGDIDTLKKWKKYLEDTDD